MGDKSAGEGLGEFGFSRMDSLWLCAVLAGGPEGVVSRKLVALYARIAKKTISQRTTDLLHVGVPAASRTSSCIARG